MRFLKIYIQCLSIATFMVAPIAIVWLCVLGQWWVLLLALASLFSHFPLSIAMLPGLALAFPAGVLADRHPRLSAVLLIPLHLYTAVVMMFWCIGALALVFTLARRQASPESCFVPLTLLAFSIGCGPWVFMASKETQSGGGDASFWATIFMQTGFGLVTFLTIFQQPFSLQLAWAVFATVMLVGVLCAAIMNYCFAAAGFAQAQSASIWADDDV